MIYPNIFVKNLHFLKKSCIFAPILQKTGKSCMEKHVEFSFEEQHPYDIIIRSIRQHLLNGEMKPGDRLPAERKLAEEYGVSRNYVREALKALEGYGIVETRPQSGTFIVGLDVNALDGIFADVLRLDAFDFASMVEMRAILEVNAARMCAQRRTDEQLVQIKQALDNYISAFEQGNQEQVYSTDFEFHRTIAAGSGNTTLRSMLMLITPDILSSYRKQSMCSVADTKPLEEHKLLYRFIAEQRPEVAAELMKAHLEGTLNYAKQLREQPE